MSARLVCLLSLLTAAAAGCIMHPAPRPSAEELRAAAEVLTTDVSTLRDEWYLFKAQQEVVARCMRDNGLQYLITNPGPEPSPATVTEDAIGPGHPHTYGVVSEVSALDASRADADGPPGGSTALPQDQYVSSLPPDEQDRYMQALTGSPNRLGTVVLPSGMEVNYTTGGCVGLARTRLFGSVETALRDSLLPQDVSRSAEVVLWDDARYRVAISDWRRCMEHAGWSYQSPLSAIESIRLLAAEGKPVDTLRLRETAIAEADSVCDSRSAFRATQRAILTDYLRRQPPSIIKQLADVLEARRAAVRIAVAVVPR